MLSWLKKVFGRRSLEPESVGEEPVPGGNPARGPSLRLAVTGPAGERMEEIDLAQTLSRVFFQLGRAHTVQKSVLTDEETGIEFRPGIVSFQPLEDLSMSMCTTIEVVHPQHFPEGFFEYQHSCEVTGELAVRSGFEAWAKVDLPVILDARQAVLETCTALEMELPSGRKRRVLLGPVSYMRQPEKEGTPDLSAEEDENGEHPPFCRCCLFTNSASAFQSLIDSDGVHAVRLFAMRDEDGNPGADCRVNGEDDPAGKEALLAYAATWPPAGTEFRKQYVIIRDQPEGAGEGAE
jgi:hypothetical protein